MVSLLKRTFASPGVIIVAAFAIRMVFLIQYQLSLPPFVVTFHPIGYETGSIARSIALGHGFSSPLGVETGPTAWLTPVYPYLLAAVFKVFGVFSPASNLVILTLNCVFSAFTCLPLYLVGRRVFEPWVGVGAAWIWAVMPRSIYFSTNWVWDTSLCAMLMAVLVLITLKMGVSRGTLAWIGYGALWALTLLTNPAFVTLVPFFLLWLALYRRNRGNAWMRPLALATVTLAVGVSPWLVRNYLVLGKFVPFRSNFGLELFLGNNPAVVNAWSWWLHPNDNAEERAQFQQLGELQYMAAKQHEAVQYMRTHAGEVLWLNWDRFTQTWAAGDSLSDMLRYGNWETRAKTLFLCALSFFGFAGVFLAYRKRVPAAVPLGTVLFVFPIVYYVTHTNSRYRHPLDPVLALLAVYAVREIYLKLRSRFFPCNHPAQEVEKQETIAEQTPEPIGAPLSNLATIPA
jgi:4-amino-4-deoxy-L-arabinose transferase-like glycosyltransferase